MKSFEEDDPEKSLCLDPTPQDNDLAQEDNDQVGFLFAAVFLIASIIALCLILSTNVPKDNPHIIDENENTDILKLKVVSMDFTAELNNNTNSTKQHVALVSARWDLLIRVPGIIVGHYICLQGNLQASFLYKNVTLATSSLQSYKKLESGMPQLLNISAVANEEELSGAIGKEIIEAIKERKEVKFGSRMSLTDCRELADKSMVRFECNETTLRLEPGSDHIKATAKNHPTCQTSLSY